MGLFVPRYLVIGDTITDDPEIYNNLALKDKRMICLRTMTNIIVLLPTLEYFTMLSHDNINSCVMRTKIDDDLNIKSYKLLSLKKRYFATKILHISVVIRLPTLKNMRMTCIYKLTLFKYMCLIHTPMFLHISMCMDVVDKIFSIVVIPCIHDYYFRQFCNERSNCEVVGGIYDNLTQIFRSKLEKVFMNIKYEL